MIKYVDKSNLVYYFRNRQNYEWAMSYSKSKNHIMAFADIVIDPKTNIFIKVRSNIEEICDIYAEEKSEIVAEWETDYTRVAQ